MPVSGHAVLVVAFRAGVIVVLVRAGFVAVCALAVLAVPVVAGFGEAGGGQVGFELELAGLWGVGLQASDAGHGGVELAAQLADVLAEVAEGLPRVIGHGNHVRWCRG